MPLAGSMSTPISSLSTNCSQNLSGHIPLSITQFYTSYAVKVFDKVIFCVLARGLGNKGGVRLFTSSQSVCKCVQLLAKFIQGESHDVVVVTVDAPHELSTKSLNSIATSLVPGYGRGMIIGVKTTLYGEM